MAQENDKLLKRLVEARAEFILVGGVAANLHGSSQLTKDLDVVAPLTQANCERILGAVNGLDPRFYQTPGRPPVQRTARELSEFRNLYFDTTLGRIDILGSLPPVGEFARVAEKAVSFSLSGMPCRVVGLDDLIAVKAHVGRPKDKAVEIELRAVRDRLRAKAT